MSTSLGYLYARKIEEFNLIDIEKYSKFKHGSKSLAREFGFALGDSFVKSDTFTELVKSNKPIVVCPAPFNNIPTASYTLKDYFLARLADACHQYDVEIEEVKVYRKHSYNTEYGEMTASERDKAISADTFQIDREFVSGKHVIFVDDCRISGAHERRMQYMVNKQKLNISSSYIYYAALTTENADPRIENQLNHQAIHNIDSIIDLILYDEFTWNTRVVKKVLRSNVTDLSRFVSRLMDKSADLAVRTIHTMVTYAILNGYHKDETMTESINDLRAFYNTQTMAVL
jgi:hypothetical protein